MNSKLTLEKETLKTLLVVIITPCLLFSCSTNKPEKNSPKIIINQNSMKKSPEDIAFWMMFALGESVCSKNYPMYSFGEFSCAFQLASLLLSNESPKKSMPKSQFQRDLIKIIDAGFLKEYTFHQYRQSHWFLQSNLNNEAYFSWMKSNLPEHQPGDPSSASMERETTQQPDTSDPVKLSNNFLTEIGNLKYLEQHRYEKNSLGLRLRYTLENDDQAWLDFYIYPNQRFTKKFLLSNLLADEATSAKAAILYYAQEYKAEKMEVIEETYSDDNHFLTGIYLVTVNGSPVANELYVSGNESFIVKARGTFPFERKSYYSSEVKAILDSLLANITFATEK